MHVATLPIRDLLLLTPARHGDARGFLTESYSRRDLLAVGIDVDFVQDNHSLSVPQGVLRGLHFQAPPFAQAKLVRVTRGSILDVAVDLRRGSPTFGQHIAAVLDSGAGKQLFLPEGFAHGFCTLEPNTEVQYKVSRYYSPAHDKGLLWDDPMLGIEWPVSREVAIISAKDRCQPLLVDLPPYFRYDAGGSAAAPVKATAKDDALA